MNVAKFPLCCAIVKLKHIHQTQAVFFLNSSSVMVFPTIEKARSSLGHPFCVKLVLSSIVQQFILNLIMYKYNISIRTPYVK